MLSFGIDTAPQSGVSISRQDWGPNAEGGLGDGSPTAMSRSRAPGGGLGRSSQML